MMDDILDFLKKNPPNDIGALQKILDEHMNAQNARGLSAFCGLSPNQMQGLLYAPFEDGSPVGFRQFDLKILDNCPIFCTAEEILRRTVLAKSPFKMTAATGSLPVKLVKEIYEAAIFKDEHIERGISKLGKETDVNFLHAARLVLEMTPAVRKLHGTWVLTKKGEQLVLPQNRAALFREFFSAFALKFNWAYFDAVQHPNAGQMGFAWLLAALSHFGGTERFSGFYAEKYLAAFPMLTENAAASTWSTPAKTVASGVDIRFLARFCHWFGLAAVTDHGYSAPSAERLTIRKTDFLDAVFYFPKMVG